MSSPLLALENPFAGAVHSQADELREYGRVWARSVGLVQSVAEMERFDDALYWKLIAGAYPTAPWPILTIAHDWACWGFCLDDFDDASELTAQPDALRAMFGKIVAVLRDEPLPANAHRLLRVVADVWERMCQHSTNEWRSRFIRTLSDCFDAYYWEARNRRGQRLPSVEEYIDYRHKTGGWRTLVLLVDLVMGQTLPERTATNPALLRLLDTANNVICWANDLLSYEKERANGETHNLIPVTQAEYHCSTDDAIRMVVDWHNREVQHWQQEVKWLPRWWWSAEEKRHVQAYIDFSERYMQVNHVWTQMSGRYLPAAVAA